jgi:putative salt-induced outer membrane protein
MHRRASAVLAFPLLCAPLSALAQDPAAEPKSPWSGEVTAGLVSTSGNSETTTANGKVQVIYSVERWKNTFDAAALKSQQTTTDAVTLVESEQVTAERYFVADKADYNMTAVDYLFLQVEYEKDLVGPVRQRTSETVGYGRKVLTGPDHFLDLELGAGMRQTESQITLPAAPVAVKEDDVIGRGRLAYKWKLSETSHFAETIKVESGDSNTFLESVTELRVSLIGKLYAQGSYTVRQNTDVPPGSEKTDTITALSLGWTFGK